MTAPYTPPPPDLPPPLNRKEERLLHRIEKAGVRASHRAGHPVSREELLEVKIQIIPLAVRLFIGVLALASAWAGFTFATAGDIDGAFGFGFFAVVLFLFAIFGVRRTLAKVFDGMDSGAAFDLTELAIRAIAAALKAVHH